MEKTTIKDTLRELAQDSGKRSKIGRLREAFGDILAAQKAGVTNAKIVEALNSQHGLGLTLKTFETMLYRLRREAGARPTKTGAPASTAGPARPAAASPRR